MVAMDGLPWPPTDSIKEYDAPHPMGNFVRPVITWGDTDLTLHTNHESIVDSEEKQGCPHRTALICLQIIRLSRACNPGSTSGQLWNQPGHLLPFTNNCRLVYFVHVGKSNLNMKVTNVLK